MNEAGDCTLIRGQMRKGKGDLKDEMRQARRLNVETRQMNKAGARILKAERGMGKEIER